MSDLLPTGEQSLIRQAQSGDSEAFGQLYEQYAPAVFRFLFAHLEDRLDAEDLTEEVFLRVWQALPGFQEQGAPFGGFLFRVARNALYDHYRRIRRRPTTALAQDWQDDLQPDPAVSVPEHMERQTVRKALATLGDDHRQVLSLRFLAGLSPDETAAAMGRSAGAIRVLQHRALAALRKLLPGQNHEQEMYDGAHTGRIPLPGISKTD